MEKKIEDFLHLYLGCRVQISFAEKVLVESAIFELWMLNAKWFNLKPILRPLSSMTIEEGAWCLKETYFDHVDYPIRDFTLELVGQNKNNPRIKINNDWFANELTFGSSNGSVWNAQDTLPCNTKIKATVFAYLLKQSFDLFGLHEAGLCLYESDLNKQNEPTEIHD